MIRIKNAIKYVRAADGYSMVIFGNGPNPLWDRFHQIDITEKIMIVMELLSSDIQADTIKFIADNS